MQPSEPKFQCQICKRWWYVLFSSDVTNPAEFEDAMCPACGGFIEKMPGKIIEILPAS